MSIGIEKKIAKYYALLELVNYNNVDVETDTLYVTMCDIYFDGPEGLILYTVQDESRVVSLIPNPSVNDIISVLVGNCLCCCHRPCGCLIEDLWLCRDGIVYFESCEKKIIKIHNRGEISEPKCQNHSAETLHMEMIDEVVTEMEELKTEIVSYYKKELSDVPLLPDIMNHLVIGYLI